MIVAQIKTKSVYYPKCQLQFYLSSFKNRGTVQNDTWWYSVLDMSFRWSNL